MGYPFDTNYMALPGLESILETVQNQFWWGRQEQQTFLPCVVAAATTDGGNTVTTTLRGGLLLGKITASGKLTDWDPTATDGSEVIFGILPAPLTMSNNGTTTDRYTYVFVGGNVYSDRLLIPGSASEGLVDAANEFLALQQLNDRGIRHDRHLQYGHPFSYRPRFMTTAEIAADAVSVLTSDHGRTFNFAAADDATAVTLPEPKPGLVFSFVNPVAQTITLDIPTGKFLTPGSNTQDTIALTVGESCRLTGISTSLYWAEITEAATD